MSKFTCLSTLVLTAFIVPFAGCGGSTGELMPVSGTVTVAGKPVEGITVIFLGEAVEGQKRVTPYGQTDAEGKFTIKISETETGAPAGTYTVLFQKLTMPDGSPIPEGESAADVGAVNQIPEVYSTPNNASEKVTVSAGGTDSLKFDLKGKR